MNQINSPAGYYQGGQQPQPTQPQPQPGAAVGAPPNQMLPINQDNDNLSDPLIKSKELLQQLKISLSHLLNQLSIVLNPQNENNRAQNDNQFQVLGKYVENFNRACDLLIINLRTVFESQQISNDLKNFMRYYASIVQEQGRYNNDLQSANLQMQRIADVKRLLQDFVSGPIGAGSVHSSNEIKSNPTQI